MSDQTDESVDLLDVLLTIGENLRLVMALSLAAGCAALGFTFLMNPVFTARTLIVPPQQLQSASASALASLGNLSGLAGAASAIRSPAEQYVSLMLSRNVTDQLVQKFNLVAAFATANQSDARERLVAMTEITVGKKDGLISIAVSDTSPQRAADLANQYVDELRRLTSGLAITEPQQRRAFFEAQLAKTRENLARAQVNLKQIGFSAGSIKAEPRALADAFTRIQSEVAAAEMRLQMLRQSLSDTAPEVKQQSAVLATLKARAAAATMPATAEQSPDYISKYREYRYHETMFELVSRQYEAARLDEAREGALIQVVDKAVPPERKSRPRRGFTAIMVTVLSFLLMCAWVVTRQVWRVTTRSGAGQYKAARVSAAWTRAFSFTRQDKSDSH